MQSRLTLAFPLLVLFLVNACTHTEAQPLKILLINGGCCHDYDAQGVVIKAAIESKLQAEVKIEVTPSKKTDARFAVYESPDWAKGYDVIIHNECSANVKDPAYVKRILDAHRAGVPAVNLHCAMHSYRWGKFKKPVTLGADNAHWFEMIGLQSSGHGPKGPVDVKYEKTDHPLIKGLKDWTTPAGELYNNIQIFEGTKVLAEGIQAIEGKPTDSAAIVWTNLYGPQKTKIVSISIGHSSEEMKDENFAELLHRSVLWATDNINADGSPRSGLAK